MGQVGRARLQFGFATGTELEAMDAERISIHRCDRKSDPELLWRLPGSIWMLGLWRHVVANRRLCVWYSFHHSAQQSCR